MSTDDLTGDANVGGPNGVDITSGIDISVSDTKRQNGKGSGPSLLQPTGADRGGDDLVLPKGLNVETEIEKHKSSSWAYPGGLVVEVLDTVKAVSMKVKDDKPKRGGLQSLKVRPPKGFVDLETYYRFESNDTSAAIAGVLNFTLQDSNLKGLAKDFFSGWITFYFACLNETTSEWILQPTAANYDAVSRVVSMNVDQLSGLWGVFARKLTFETTAIATKAVLAAQSDSSITISDVGVLRCFVNAPYPVEIALHLRDKIEFPVPSSLLPVGLDMVRTGNAKQKLAGLRLKARVVCSGQDAGCRAWKASNDPDDSQDSGESADVEKDDATSDNVVDTVAAAAVRVNGTVVPLLQQISVAPSGSLASVLRDAHTRYNGSTVVLAQWDASAKTVSSVPLVWNDTLGNYLINLPSTGVYAVAVADANATLPVLFSTPLQSKVPSLTRRARVEFATGTWRGKDAKWR